MASKTSGKTRSQTAGRLEELRADLARKIAQIIGSESTRPTGVPGLTLFREIAPTNVWCGTYEPNVGLVVQGRKRVELGRNTFFYDPTQFLLTSVDLPVASQVVDASKEVPYLCLRLDLEIPAVQELLRREGIRAVDAPSDRPAMTTAKTTVELLDAFSRLLDLVNTPNDIPFLGPHIQREIIYRILRSSEGNRLRQIATQHDQSQQTAKAIAWIRKNYAKPLRVERLAEIAGMAPSTLHHHFRVLTAMSPVQYQKQLRLNAARQRMLMSGVDAASAAFEVGYESASQFSREYSRFFGVPPMRDIRSLRSPQQNSVNAQRL